MRSAIPSIILATLLGLPASVEAIPIASVDGAYGISTPDRQAGFDTLGNGLAAHTEDFLSITSNAFQFNGAFFSPVFTGPGAFYGPNSSGQPYVIGTTDSAVMSALEFGVGSGFLGDPLVHVLVWQTFLNTVSTGSGSFSLPQPRNVATVFHLSDMSGFDILHVGLFRAPHGTEFIGTNALALDNLHVSLRPATSVPEPGTLLLLSAGLAGFAFARRRRQ